MKKIFSADALKYIAIFTMTLDHVAWFFLPFEGATAQLFHFLGRLTAPIMCYFIAEGYTHTRSVSKFAARVLTFGALSQIPWWMLHGNKISLSFNMLFTLFLCLMAVLIWDKAENKLLALICVFALVYLSNWCDWHIYAVLWTLCFFVFKESKGKMCLSFLAVWIWCFSENLMNTCYLYGDMAKAIPLALYPVGSLFALPLIFMYNGKKGKFRWSKQVFYWYYPVHLLIIAILNEVI